MPVYEYHCSACERDFEREQRISDPPVKTCPLCKSRRVRRLISRTSFVLKGGGWYSDLYASSDGKDKGKEKTAEGEAASASKQDAKTETKTSGDEKKSGKKTAKKASSES